MHRKTRNNAYPYKSTALPSLISAKISPAPPSTSLAATTSPNLSAASSPSTLISSSTTTLLFPFKLATVAFILIFPPAYSVSTPIGTEHPPSNALISARSATHLSVVTPCLNGANSPAIASSSLRISTPSAPCPTACRSVGDEIGAVIRWPRSRRSSPAEARIKQA